MILWARSRSVKRQDRWSNWKRTNKLWTLHSSTSASRGMLHTWCIILWRRSPAVCNYICRLYASSSKTTKVIVLLHELFLTNRGEVDSNTLPPWRTVFSSTYNHITKQEYRRWRCNETPLCARTQLSWLFHWRLTGCMAMLLQMQFYNFFHVNAKGNAYKNSVPVWTMATNAKHQSTILNALI